MKKLSICLGILFLPAVTMASGNILITGNQGTITGITPGTGITANGGSSPVTSGNVTIAATGGGGGASTLAVSQNGVIQSSPTAVMNFLTPFGVALIGGATAQITLNSSSVTLQGQNVIFLQNSLQSGATFYVSSGTVKGPFSVVFSSSSQGSTAFNINLSTASQNTTGFIINTSSLQVSDFMDFYDQASTYTFDASGDMNIQGNYFSNPGIAAGFWAYAYYGASGVNTTPNYAYPFSVAPAIVSVPAMIQYQNYGNSFQSEAGFVPGYSFGVLEGLGQYDLLIATVTGKTMIGGNMHGIQTPPIAQLHVVTSSGNVVGQIIEAVQPNGVQTADLEEWENTSGVVLSSIAANGNALFPIVTASTVNVTTALEANGSAGTSGYILQSNGNGSPPSWVANSGGGGSGSSTLAVGTGTASNFTTNVSSPTAAISFLGSQFNSTAVGTTNFMTLNPSSVTLQGTILAGTNITLTPAAGTLTIAASGSSGGASTLAVGTGTASNFTTNVSSPTAAISFLGTQFTSLASGTTNFVTANGSGITKFNYTFNPDQARSTSTANMCQISNSTTQFVSSLLCDDTTEQDAMWSTILNPYQGGSLKADVIYTMVSATSGGIENNVQIYCSTDTINPQTVTWSSYNEGASTVPSVVGAQKTQTISLSNLGGSCVSGAVIMVRYARDAANASDTATGKGGPIKLRIYEP